MNNLTNVFENKEFGRVRTVESEGKILFVASDIAKALAYRNVSKAVNDHCKGITKCYIPTNSGQQEMLIIPEGDVYRLIARSKLPAAEKFESWVFDEVLPQIRKTGSYEIQQQDEKTILSRAVLIAQAQIMQLQEQTSQQAAELAEAQPAIRFAAACDKTDGMTMEEVAKTLNIKGYGRNNLFKLMYRKGIFANRQPDKPKQRYMDQGLFLVELKPATRTTHDGERVDFMAAQAKVTPKGFDWIERLIQQDIEEKAAEAEAAAAEEEARELERLEQFRPRLRRVK